MGAALADCLNRSENSRKDASRTRHFNSRLQGVADLDDASLFSGINDIDSSKCDALIFQSEVD
jgi:hypothetical protein